MNNKPGKDEFLGYIHSMWKQGEITESALIKIREMYCREKSKKQEVLDQILEDQEQLSEHIFQNKSSDIEGIHNNIKTEIVKEQIINVPTNAMNEIKNNEVKAVVNEQYVNKKIQDIGEKSKLTKERNITVVLSLGILLILLAGIILATSTWGLMSNGVKTIALLMVSILFFIMSSFTEKKLKILKTSFAFWVLGNLFLPVILLSIGFFKLLGNYLSISGQGRYIYGIISAFICLIFFGYSIRKYKNTAFTWITLINSQILYWFILKQIDFSSNMYILMLLIYTLCLTVVYYKLHKKQSVYDFVTKTVKWYALINLIVNVFIFLGNTLYFTAMTMINDPVRIIQGMIIIFGIIILASIMTYWNFEFKFNGGAFVSGILILSIQMLCVLLKINIHEFTYFVVMHIGLLVIYGVIYYYNTFKHLKYIKVGTDVIILSTMGILDLLSSITIGGMYTAVLLYVLAIIIFITIKEAKEIFYINLLKILIPVVIFTANLFILESFGLLDQLVSRQKFHINIIYIILNIAVIYGISLILRFKKKNDYKTYFYEANLFLGCTYFLTLIYEIDRLIVGVAIATVAAICLFVAKKDLKIRVYLYGLITMVTIVLFDLERYLRLNKMNVFILKPQNLFLCVSLILTIIWMGSKEKWRKKLDLYIIGMYSFGFLSSLIFNDFKKLDYSFLCFLILCMGIMGMFLYKCKKSMLTWIPITYFWIMSLRMIYYFDQVNQIPAYCFVACMIMAIGYILYNVVENISEKEMSCYNILSGLSLLLAIIISLEKAIPFVFNIFAFIVFGAFLYYTNIFVKNKYLKRSLVIGCIVFNYFAYGRLISEIEFLSDFKSDFLLVPSIIALNLIINYYSEKKNSFANSILGIWYSIVGIILLFIHQDNSALQAIVYCGLCLISIIAGFIIQQKLYFVGGVIFLLIGVFLNTLNFWLNVPWWIYLLVGGTLLIFFASKNEFNKSNKRDKKESFMSKVLRRIKTW